MSRSYAPLSSRRNGQKRDSFVTFQCSIFQLVFASLLTANTMINNLTETKYYYCCCYSPAIRTLVDVRGNGLSSKNNFTDTSVFHSRFSELILNQYSTDQCAYFTHDFVKNIKQSPCRSTKSLRYIGAVEAMQSRKTCVVGLTLRPLFPLETNPGTR